MVLDVRWKERPRAPEGFGWSSRKASRRPSSPSGTLRDALLGVSTWHWEALLEVSGRPSSHPSSPSGTFLERLRYPSRSPSLTLEEGLYDITQEAYLFDITQEAFKGKH